MKMSQYQFTSSPIDYFVEGGDYFLKTGLQKLHW